MKLLTVLPTLFLITTCVHGDQTDVGLNPGEMIANHGYPSETHHITTDDGYIVTLYRIPHGINDNGSAPRPPAFLMHGFSSCSGEFVSLGPDRGLAYLLADAGYDVWLGNARGTTPSRNHTSIDVNVNPEKYFDFTWHEIAIYDLASSIDYVLEKNGGDGVYYVGHSQGTTNFLVLTSTRPEYNDKIKVASLMAPAAIIKHYPNILIQDLCKHLDTVWMLLQRYQIYEIPYITRIRNTVTQLCGEYPNGESDPLCDFLYEAILSKVNKGDLAAAASNCPSSAGLKQYVHYGQLVRDGGFRQFDHGKEKNLEIYGTETPPDYDTSKITTPVAFYYANNDHIISIEDENTLAGMVPNVAINYLVPDENFGHLDFAMHNDVVKLVYDKLISVMSEY